LTAGKNVSAVTMNAFIHASNYHEHKKKKKTQQRKKKKIKKKMKERNKKTGTRKSML